jgi:hypothetical protein
MNSIIIDIIKSKIFAHISQRARESRIRCHHTQQARQGRYNCAASLSLADLTVDLVAACAKAAERDDADSAHAHHARRHRQSHRPESFLLVPHAHRVLLHGRRGYSQIRHREPRC